ncbi:hypothetical protein L1049_017900 [Liquidambar formosana]|uniref:Uncharacterized protein n=1 Tax=Liquidambar formosana TaxID=63359 RepID=A0AAP0NHK0_LIQFO
MAFATILRRSACSVTPLANRLVETQSRHHHFAIFTALYHTPLSQNPSSSPFLQTFRPSFSAAAKPPRSDVDTDYHDRQKKFGSQSELLTSSIKNGVPSVSMLQRGPRPGLCQCAAVVPTFPHRSMTTMGNPVESVPQDSSASIADIAPRIKFKRLDKTAKHIMQILDKEAVEEVRAQREIPVYKAWLYHPAQSGSS